MGLNFSCPFSEHNDVEDALESVRVKSISFGYDEVKTPVRKISFGTRDSEPKILKSLGSGKMIVERSVSFQGRDLEKRLPLAKANSLDVSVKLIRTDCDGLGNRSPKMNDGEGEVQKLKIFDPTNPKHEAAIKLQKVYKSFRTRRKLADCAVLVEQSWWKLLDFVALKHSSISFFELEKHETAISRWSRARTRAAKVGKGLSKNDKAQKLALQHWLEAIDPRHRYGHNLHFYYVKWLHSKSREPFFYWLDIGEGKEVNLVDKCPRCKLQQQCIKYLGPMERKGYEIVVEDGKLMYKQTRELLHTTGDVKWIFVLSTSKNLYVGKKKKGTFQHSSFLAGGVTTAAGRLVVEHGILKAVWPHSGHYRPTEDNFKDFLSFLRENDVDLTDLKTAPADEEEDSSHQQTKHLRMSSYDEELSQTVDELVTEDINNEVFVHDSNGLAKEESPVAVIQQKSIQKININEKLTNLEVPKEEVFFEIDKNEPANSDGYQSANEEFIAEQDPVELEENLLDKKHEENEEEDIPEEAILRRINSKKGTGSYQLGKQLSCKWTTGAGPRIGCVRDYPSKLQFQALEQVNLSPRGILHSKSSGVLSRKESAPTNFTGKVLTITGSSVPGYGEFLQRNFPITKAHSLPRDISSRRR